MKARKIYLFLILALLAPLSFTACDDGHPEYDITLNADYREVIDAIGDANRSLADKMALIEAAMNTGLTENATLLELIREAVSSLDGTLEEKLAAMEAAMLSQSTALETKLALVEAAVTGGFADDQAQRDLLQQAVSSLGGTLEENISAIEAAVKSQTTALETKIGLVEVAVRKGFADQGKAQALITEALEALGGTLEEKLAAVEAAVESQTADLGAKMALIETAGQEGFAGQQKQQELIRKAVESLGGSLDEKLSAIEAAITSETSSLETKLALVEEALKSSTADTDEALDLILKAVQSVAGSMSDRLSALESALRSQSTSLESKLGLIATAVQEGFMAATASVGAMRRAFISSQGDLDGDLEKLRDSILVDLDTIAARLTPAELAKALTDIVNAINTQSQTTKDQLLAIQEAIQEVVKAIQPISFSLTASSPSFGFKKAWAVGDSIFVFFSNVKAPRYLKMGYDGTGWTCKEKIGAVDSVGCFELSNLSTGMMTAIYLPFGSGLTVSADGSAFVFSDTSTPWYLTATLPYTVSGRDVSGNLDMQVPEGYVQFSVDDAGADAATATELREPKLTPQGIVSIAADGTIKHTSIAHGAPLRGFACDDGALKGYVFGGILAADVRNVDTSYHFTLVKGGWKGDYYYRSVTTSLYRPGNAGRSLDLYPVSTWTRITDYKPIDMGCDWSYSNGEKQRVYWASRNLGATSDNPDDEEATYGNYYAWGETSPKTDYSSETYSGTEDDAARTALGGIWRMPKGGEWEILAGAQFEWTWQGKGYVVTTKVAGYDGADGPSLFIPAAGYYNGNELLSKGSLSRYWSSTLTTGGKARVLASYDTSTPKVTYDMACYLGLSVRPVTY